MKWLLVVFFRFQEFSPNSDLNSSFSSVPRRPNPSTQAEDAGEAAQKTISDYDDTSVSMETEYMSRRVAG